MFKKAAVMSCLQKLSNKKPHALETMYAAFHNIPLNNSIAYIFYQCKSFQFIFQHFLLKVKFFCIFQHKSKGKFV